MSKPPSRKLAGGSISDDQGNRKWKWQEGEEIDTAQVRALGEGLVLDETGPGQSANPYDRTPTPEAEAAPKKRRTLDDMRRLSEQIRKAKHWKRDAGE